LLEVRPLNAVRCVSAAAVFTAAVVVYAVCRERRLHQELARARSAAASERLMAGCVVRDLVAFRARIDLAAAEREVVAEAGRVLDGALAVHATQIDPNYPEGGPV
jgi:hypothetical protein